MSETPTIQWPGISGEKYKYWIYPINTSFKEEGGNYIFAKNTTNGWVPIYIGQTKNLSDRLSNHNKEDRAIKNGATHLHVHLNSNEIDRLSEEKDLIAQWKPVCNDQI